MGATIYSVLTLALFGTLATAFPYNPNYFGAGFPWGTNNGVAYDPWGLQTGYDFPRAYPSFPSFDWESFNKQMEELAERVKEQGKSFNQVQEDVLDVLRDLGVVDVKREDIHSWSQSSSHANGHVEEKVQFVAKDVNGKRVDIVVVEKSRGDNVVHGSVYSYDENAEEIGHYKFTWDKNVEGSKPTLDNNEVPQRNPVDETTVAAVVAVEEVGTTV